METATLSGGRFHMREFLAENLDLGLRGKKLICLKSIEAPILFKKHAECGMRTPLSKRLRSIVTFLACKTPGRKVCGLGFPFRTLHQGRSRATFGTHFEQKRERSYSPKRFSSSSLMIFNAFTRA